MAVMTSSLGKLWRYNYQVIAGGGYWIVVLPVAASQIVTLYMMALSTEFKPPVAMKIAELMTPIIGAFLVAHSLAPEYRSGIGAVLASKPVSLHRVVTIRVGLAMFGALLLTFATLQVCSIGLMRIDVWTPLLMSLPSLLFLSLVALTFATLFRNALGGFGVAAVIWALDVGLGYSIHPVLSLQGRRAFDELEPMAEIWPYGKAALVVIGLLLLGLHSRLLHRVCVNAERRDMVRVGALTVIVLLLYAYSGAAVKVGYLYLRRGNLTVGDLTWIRRQLTVYGPVPVSRLFGRPFHVYVSRPQLGDDAEAVTRLREAQLEQALSRWPKSRWADSISFALATERESRDPLAAMEGLLRMAAEFSDSPLAPLALRRAVAIAEPSIPEATRLRAARSLLSDYPDTKHAERAARYLESLYPGAVDAAEMEQAAQVASKVARRLEQPGWLATLAELQDVQGKTTAAIESARRARTMGLSITSGDDPSLDPKDIQVNRAPLDAAITAATELLTRLGAQP